MRFMVMTGLAAAGLLSLCAHGSVTIDFDPSGEFTNNFSGAVYAESATGGLNGSIGLVGTNNNVANFDGPQSESLTLVEDGDAMTMGIFFNPSSFGTAVDPFLRMGVTLGGNDNYATFGWLDLDPVDSSTGTFVLRQGNAGSPSPSFSLTTGQWYYMEGTVALDAIEGCHYQVSVHNASSDGTIGSLLAYKQGMLSNATEFKPGFTVYASFKGNTGFDQGAAAVLDNFYASNTGVSQAGSQMAIDDTAGNQQVDLSWTAVTDADSYSVYRSTEYAGSFSELTNVSTTAYSDTAAGNYTNYFYYVEALSGTNVLATSPTVKSYPFDAGDTTPPAAPQGLTVVSAVGEVVLSWTANTEVDLDPEGAYAVYRSDTSEGAYSVVASNLVLNGYTDISVTGGETYYYKVTATDFAGNESALSTEVPAAVQALVADGTIDIIGNTTGEPGGEFADYSSLGENAAWDDSEDDDGVVRFSISRTSLYSNEVSAAKWKASTYTGPNTEINFTKGTAGTVALDRANALTNKAFIAIQLDSSGFDSAPFTLDSVAIAMWRNGTASPTDYQFAYDDEGDGFDSGDFIGDGVSNNLDGTNNTFTNTVTLTTAQATSHEVRMYYWGGGTTFSGHTHLFAATAEYTAGDVDYYGNWASQFGGTNVIGTATDDYDNDGISNLGEYAINGNPTNAAERGQFSVLNDGSTFTYVHSKVTDNENLIYRLLDTIDLVSGTQNTNAYTSQTAGPIVDNYQMVTNTYNMTSDKMFIELEVEQQ